MDDFRGVRSNLIGGNCVTTAWQIPIYPYVDLRMPTMEPAVWVAKDPEVVADHLILEYEA
jgi:hypothetical protein